MHVTEPEKRPLPMVSGDDASSIRSASFQRFSLPLSLVVSSCDIGEIYLSLLKSRILIGVVVDPSPSHATVTGLERGRFWKPMLPCSPVPALLLRGREVFGKDYDIPGVQWCYVLGGRLCPWGKSLFLMKILVDSV